jgi:hypothetical protein
MAEIGGYIASRSGPCHNKPVDIAEEDQRVRMLKRAVDLHLQIIAVQPYLTREEALGILESVRALSRQLFPDKEETFDLIYAPRFERVIRERFGPGPEN